MRRGADLSPQRPPIIIIGAPRSGTNVMRDVVCRLPGFGTWPCDEINPIWRHGNASYRNDALPPELATPAVCSMIRGRFERLASSRGLTTVVEKTCANSLRVAFVDRVVPDARYLFILRRPDDAVASAMLRWQAPFDLAYSLRKLRVTPLVDVPRYALLGVGARVRKVLTGARQLATWGPRPVEAESWGVDMPLAELCARQWRACVTAAVSDLRQIETERVAAITYEEFTAGPAGFLRSLRSQWRLELSDTAIEAAVEGVSRRSVGKGERSVTAGEHEQIVRLTSPAFSEALAWIADRRTSGTRA